MLIDPTRCLSLRAASRMSLAIALIALTTPLSRAAEVDLEATYFRDDVATALVILRNEDEGHGYARVEIECVFELSGRPVGARRAEISDLRYRQHTAVRLSTPVEGNRFDHASCRVTDAKVK